MAGLRSVSAFGAGLLLVMLIVAWELFARFVLPRYEPMAELLLPPPSAGVSNAVELISQGQLLYDVLASARRVYIGFAVAALVAIPVGIAMGLSGVVFRQLNPIIGAMRPIPPVAWIPITLLWFGVTDTQQYFIIFVGTIFPMLLNTTAGVLAVDPIIRRAALSLGANRRAMFGVMVRAALPGIFVGIRTSLGLAWFIIIAAEMVSASTGLGFLIIAARTAMRTQQMYVGMFAVGLIGFLQDQLLQYLRARLMPWL